MYTLIPKRALVEEGGTIEWVSGSFGSHVSYLYPMSILNGTGAHSEFTGVTFAGHSQNLDTGCKVVHNAPKTTSIVKHTLYFQEWRHQHFPQQRSCYQ